MNKTAKAVVIVLISMMTSVVMAQTTSSNMSKNEKPAVAQLTAQECKAYIEYMTTHTAAQMGLEPVDSFLLQDLFQHNNEPAFIVLPTDSVIAGRKYAAGDSIGAYIIRTDMLRLFSYPIRSNAKEVVAARALDRKLKLAAARAWAVEELNEGRPRSGSEIVAKLSDGQTVTIPTRMRDDFGWSVVAGGTYQFGNSLNAFSGEAGVRYTHQLDKAGKWFAGAQVLGSLRKTYLNGNANEAGDNYVAYGTVADMLIGKTFGRHRQFRLALVAGLNWEFYKTDSQRRNYADGSWDELSSEGNYLSPEVKLMAQYQGINWPVALFFSAGARQHTSVWQNEDSKISWLGQVEVGVEIPIFRHWTNNR